MDLAKLLGQKPETETFEPTMSKEEYAAMMQERREELWSGINAQAQEVFGGDEQMKSFLDFTAGNTPQSARNLLLLYSQDKSITQAKTFEKWKELGRSVKSNQSGYTYIVSQEYEKDGETHDGYVIGKAFDISQTRGRQLQPTSQREPDELLGALVSNTPVRLQVSDQLPEGVQSQYVHKQHTLFVRDGMDVNTTFHAITRELAHANFAKGNPAYQRSAYGAQAYCAAYVVGKRYGKDVSAFNFDKVCAGAQVKSPEDLRLFVSDVKTAAYDTVRNTDRTLADLEQSTPADKEFSVGEQTKPQKVKKEKDQPSR